MLIGQNLNHIYEGYLIKSWTTEKMDSLKTPSMLL